MPSRYAEKRVGKSSTHAGRNVDLHWLSHCPDRNHSTARCSRAGRNGGGRLARSARSDARVARQMAFVSRHPAHDHVSPILFAAKPVARRKTQSLGRHDGGAGKTRSSDQRATTKLFSLIATLL